MKQAAFTALIFSYTAISIFASEAPLGEPNGKGHPLIRPYEGSVLVDQYHENHSIIRFPLVLTNPFGSIKRYTEIEGELTRLIYDGPAKRTPFEMVENYRMGLAKAGFSPVTEGVPTPDPNYKASLFLDGLGSGGLRVCYNVDLKRAKYVAMSGTVRNRKIMVAVFADLCWADGRLNAKAEKPRTIIWIAEQKTLEGGKVVVDATALWSEIKDRGHASVYGIEFDFDSATIRSDSEPVLKEVGKLLSQQPNLKLYVVGHTDMMGSVDYNTELSRRRAQSVSDWLVEKARIARGRLSAYGVGFMAPVATNRNAQGQALNRRVELIEMVSKP